MAIKASTNVREFKLSLDKWVDEFLPNQLVVFHMKVTMELLRAIVQRNPVDTGRSRSNWQAGLSTDELVYPDLRLDAGEVITKAASSLEGLTPFSVIYLWNNINYIEFLEGGHSTQAPEGFVALSIVEMEVHLNAA